MEKVENYNCLKFRNCELTFFFSDEITFTFFCLFWFSIENYQVETKHKSMIENTVGNFWKNFLSRDRLATISKSGIPTWASVFCAASFLQKLFAFAKNIFAMLAWSQKSLELLYVLFNYLFNQKHITHSVTFFISTHSANFFVWKTVKSNKTKYSCFVTIDWEIMLSTYLYSCRFFWTS